MSKRKALSWEQFEEAWGTIYDPSDTPEIVRVKTANKWLKLTNEKFQRTKTTNEKFDLLSLTARVLLPEATEGVNNMMCMIKGEWSKEELVEVNGLKNKISQHAIKHWARHISSLAYRMLKLADKSSSGEPISIDHINVAYFAITSTSKTPELLPERIEDPLPETNIIRLHYR